MPSKARRAATRQAGLSRKKRRSGGRPNSQQFAAGPVQPATVTSPLSEDEASSLEPAPQTRSGTRQARAPRRAGRRAVAESSQAAMVYQHLGREVLQIGIITAIIVAILVVLTFVLR